jgi:hypothetical protein
MIRLTLTPQRSDATYTITADGDVLSIGEHVLDFSALPEGDTIPAAETGCDAIVSDVSRIDGDIYLTVIAPYGADAPDEMRQVRELVL